MTDPMTARELAERIAYDGPRIPNTGGKANTDWIADEIERAILADRAAERARLAQSGDVEKETTRLYGVLNGFWRRVPESEKQSWFDLARYVLADRAATAEAARIEARDAIADWHDAEADRLFRVEEYFADNHEQSIIFGKEASDHRKYAEYVRALRPDELEKKT